MDGYVVYEYADRSWVGLVHRQVMQWRAACFTGLSTHSAQHKALLHVRAWLCRVERLCSLHLLQQWHTGALVGRSEKAAALNSLGSVAIRILHGIEADCVSSWRHQTLAAKVHQDRCHSQGLARLRAWVFSSLLERRAVLVHNWRARQVQMQRIGEVQALTKAHNIEREREEDSWEQKLRVQRLRNTELAISVRQHTIGIGIVRLRGFLRWWNVGTNVRHWECF